MILKLLMGPLLRYGLMVLAVVGVIYQQKCSIEEKAYKAGQNSIIQKTQRVQNERIKKARRAGRRVYSKRLHKEPYQRD